MGLFAKEVEKAAETALITPVIVRTSNVAKELLQVSLTYKVSVHSLDFHLLSTQTLTKAVVEGSLEDWVELTADEVRDLGEDHFMNPKFEIKQVHEIEIYSMNAPHPLESIDMSIGKLLPSTAKTVSRTGLPLRASMANATSSVVMIRLMDIVR